MSTKYPAWAADGGNNVQMPTPEKIASGWVQRDYPPNEYFNWWQNRADSRLDDLESPRLMNTAYSAANVREGVLADGSQYDVPEYVVGSGQLKVFLDGILCMCAGVYNSTGTTVSDTPEGTYFEVGQNGNASTTIKWNNSTGIATDIEIFVAVPNRATENTYIEAAAEQAVAEALGAATTVTPGEPE